MELKDIIQKRRSVRRFSEKSLSIDLIHEIISYANLAPSAGNLQAREFIIVDNVEIKEKLSNAALDQRFIVEAPYNIIVCANLNRISSYGWRGKELYCLLDAAAAVEHILLLAVENELGTCWVSAFDENRVSKILNLPPHVRPIAIIPVGYPKGKVSSTSRINAKKLTHYNEW